MLLLFYRPRPPGVLTAASGSGSDARGACCSRNPPRRPERSGRTIQADQPRDSILSYAMRGWFADGLDAADLQKAATLLFRAGVNCGTGPPVRYARIGKAGRSMGKLGLIFGCAGLLAACTGPVRDPAAVS